MRRSRRSRDGQKNRPSHLNPLGEKDFSVLIRSRRSHYPLIYLKEKEEIKRESIRSVDI